MNGDLISRKEVITAIQKAYVDTERGMDKCAVWKNVGLTNALHIMQDLPSAQPESRREWYMKGYRDAQNAALHESCTDCPLYDHDRHNCPRFNKVIPTAILDAQQQMWIPVTEALPEDLEAVNITWVNHEPEPYYHDIKDKNFVATGIHYRDKWYWYSTTCEDFLGEYGSNEVDEVDDAVEIIAWMPLPPSYKGDEDE